jgi:hypothetical protein
LKPFISMSRSVSNTMYMTIIAIPTIVHYFYMVIIFKWVLRVWWLKSLSKLVQVLKRKFCTAIWIELRYLRLERNTLKSLALVILVIWILPATMFRTTVRNQVQNIDIQFYWTVTDLMEIDLHDPCIPSDYYVTKILW